MCKVLLLCLLATDVSLGQTQAKAPAFEVASIRAVPHGQEGLTNVGPYEGGHLVVKNGTLEFLIGMAYSVPPWNLLGKPEWLGVRQYDVSAKSEGDGGLTYKTMKPLLQQLLQQRFHLVVHRETKERPGYALVVAKGGVKLKPGKEGGPGYIMPNGIGSPSIKLADLATMLAVPAGKPVADRTGMAGVYEVDLHFAPEAATDSTLPSLFTALEEQMGLKLVSQKVPVEVLVIDHVESEPTEN